MSVTYTDRDYTHRDDVVEEAYVPVYARKRAARGRMGSRGGVKTWMILAPLGVLVVGGAAAAMMMNGGEAEPTAAPAAPAPAVAPLTDMMAAPAAGGAAALTAMRPVEAAPAPVAVERSAAPAPARRAAPVQRRAAPAAAAVEPGIAVDSGDDATAELNRAQAARTTTPSQAPVVTSTPTAEPRAPAIEVQPFPGQ
ncbi:MAG TPA: hypothetical protein VGR32_11735 [Brevundimonas sp.]|jgi:hypothetical protein|uniref:hypothetical protein n=1 Tax=Brevundimonas sp. TaxID=1871086 RepID=UPI002DE52825|nr:hypothetical protein [Brevundimonas sp.]